MRLLIEDEASIRSALALPGLGRQRSSRRRITERGQEIGSGVVAVDTLDRITTANAAAQTSLGDDAAPGSDYRAVFPDSPLPRLLDGASAVGAYEYHRPAYPMKPANASSPHSTALKTMASA